MPIDTQSKRRSVHGYGIGTIAPVADGTIDSADREHMAWLYAGISAAPPPTPEAPFVGDAYVYDAGSGTGSISGGTVIPGETIYDQGSGTGSILSGTILPSDVDYG